MTVDQILKRAEKAELVHWGAKAVQDALAAREELVPRLLEHLNAYYEQLQNPHWIPFESIYYLNLNGYRLLAQMRETSAYPLLLKGLALPGERLLYFFPEILRLVYLRDVLYGTYDGNLEATEALAANPAVDEQVRGSVLKVMGMLSKEGRIPREEMLRFLREILEMERQQENPSVISGAVEAMIPLHLHELILDARYYAIQELLEDYEYEDALDEIFQYVGGPREEWVGTDSKGNRLVDGPTPLERVLLAYRCGREDPCLCGSGKQFQDCCMQRKRELRKKYPAYRLEGDEQFWRELEPIIYPPIENVRDNPGLATYFSREAIAVDEHAYRGFKIVYRPIDYQLTDVENEIATAELWEAFQGFEKICQKRGYQTASAYDETHMVHFMAASWLWMLQQQLQKTGDSRLAAVEKWLATVERED